jgi:teichuronic acid biosynthesis glycosyltransferase TuaC
VLRVLAITKIFPNAAEPLSAPFNRQQFAALSKRCELSVMGTIPWFPGSGLLGKYSTASKLSRVPYRETIEGIDVTHPRTLFIPRVAQGTWGALYALSIAPLLAQYRNKVDIVLGSWAYPDGFAAIVAAKLLGVPCVVKLHGSDINLNAKSSGPKLMISWSLPRAAKVIAVSRALGDAVVALGVPRERVEIVMNGVDADLFHPRDREAARAELGLPAGPLALYVGNLKDEKGVTDLATAWLTVAREMPEATLVIVGGGPLEGAVEDIVRPLGDRVRMVGPRPLETISTWMAAANLLVLPSRAEGTPNVVLEALASGRRVVASAVGGVPDLITNGELGTLVPARDPDALAKAIVRSLHSPYNPATVAALGARGGWDASAAALYEVLARAVGSVPASEPRTS